MANASFGVNILPKNNTVTIGNSNSPWTIVSPSLTGTPTAPTPTAGDSSTKIATTEFVDNAIETAPKEYGEIIEFELDNVSNVSGAYSHTSTVAGAKADMTAIGLKTGNTEAFLDNVTITFGNGTITLECDNVVGSSTVTVSAYVVEELSFDPELTSTEYIKLNNAKLDKTTFTNWRPSNNGTNDQILRSNGDGTTRWDSPATTTEINTAVTSWLNTNVPTDTTVVIDKSLTQNNCAANSKTVGDELSGLKSAFNDSTDNTGLVVDVTSKFEFTNGYYISTTDGKKKGSGDYTASSNSNYVEIPEGFEFDKIRITMIVQNDSSHRGLVFYTAVDQATGILPGTDGKHDTSLANWEAETVEIAIPSTAKYIRTTWFNSNYSAYSLYDFKCELIKEGSMPEQIEELEEKTELISDFISEGYQASEEGSYLILNECADLPIKKITSSVNAVLSIRSKNIFIPNKPANDKGLTSTLVLNEDGSVDYISISGTATAAYTKSTGSILLKEGHSYYFYIGDSISSAHRMSIGTSSGGGTKKYINYNGFRYIPVADELIYLNVNVPNGTQLSDWRFSPMVTVDEPLEEYVPGYAKTFNITAGEMDMEDLNYLSLFKGYNLVHAVADSAYIIIGIEYFKDITEKINEHEYRIDELEEKVDDLIHSGENSVTGALSRQFRYLYRKNIPSYFLDENNEMYLHGKIAAFNALAGDDKFTFWTDSHWLWNAKHSMPIIGYVNSWCDITKTIYGGDILGNGKDTTKEQAQYLLAQHQDEVRDVFGRNWYYVFGNHDINQAAGRGELSPEEFYARALSFEEVYKSCIKQYEDDGQVFPARDNTKTTEWNYWNRLHYYFDNNGAKIRYIVLNSGTPNNPLNRNSEISESGQNELFLQEDWLYDTLMACPDDYGVVVIAHEFSDGLPDLDDSSKQIAEMLIACKRRESCTVKSGSSSGTTTYNFANAKAEVIMMLCGHCHSGGNIVCTLSEGTVTSDYGTTADENSIICVLTHSDTRHNIPEMVLGEKTEQAFDLFSIDRTNRKIRTVRIGFPGVDYSSETREFDY